MDGNLLPINIRIDPDVAGLLDEAARRLSAEKNLRLSKADVHRVALRELFARLGIDLDASAPCGLTVTAKGKK